MFVAFAAGLGVVAWFNYRIDPAHLFDDGRYAAQAAGHMAAGRNVVAANVDERLLQRHYAAERRTAPRVIVLGSSRIMQVDGTMIAGKPLYNAALSTATLPDLLALGTLFISAASSPDLVVIGIDPWLFDRTPRNDRWQTLGPEYRAMLTRIGGTGPRGVPGSRWEKLRTLISIGYLERSLASFDGNAVQLFGQRESQVRTVEQRLGKVAIRRADGSLGYDAAFRSRSAREIRAVAVQHGAKHVTGILKSPPLARETVQLFDRYLAWMRRRQIKIALVLTPFHPAHYRHVQAKDQTHSLLRIEAAVRGLGRKHGVRVLGAFDPAPAGCSEAEFWDGMHARGSCLRKVLQGLKTS